MEIRTIQPSTIIGIECFNVLAVFLLARFIVFVVYLSSLLCDLPRVVHRVRDRTDAAPAATEDTEHQQSISEFIYFYRDRRSPPTQHDHDDTGSRSKSPSPPASCSSAPVAHTITSYLRCCILRDITCSSPIDRGSIAHEFHHPPIIDINFYFATATTVSSSIVSTHGDQQQQRKL